ncbi:DUF397 domain-containing protein [Nocardiopsis aegyptia]|uniref:DUF397 domain-containing protein n=1 Tax=Nocardiopsis aegyptia TaxID=220378 RepID=A0A7Z0EMA1_9ACTN|nr:hypothetical protein [Nocardiopsis aegyptia]
MSPSTRLTFRKSSYSANESACVEVADLPGGAAVRDTRYWDLGHLAFAGHAEWWAFLAAARRDSRPPIPSTSSEASPSKDWAD